MAIRLQGLLRHPDIFKQNAQIIRHHRRLLADLPLHHPTIGIVRRPDIIQQFRQIMLPEILMTRHQLAGIHFGHIPDSGKNKPCRHRHQPIASQQIREPDHTDPAYHPSLLAHPLLEQRHHPDPGHIPVFRLRKHGPDIIHVGFVVLTGKINDIDQLAGLCRGHRNMRVFPSRHHQPVTTIQPTNHFTRILVDQVCIPGIRNRCVFESTPNNQAHHYKSQQWPQHGPLTGRDGRCLWIHQRIRQQEPIGGKVTIHHGHQDGRGHQ